MNPVFNLKYEDKECQRDNVQTKHLIVSNYFILILNQQTVELNYQQYSLFRGDACA